MNNLVKFFLIISIVVQFFYIINNKVKFHPKYLQSSFKENYIGDLNLPQETLEIKKIIKEENYENKKVVLCCSILLGFRNF